ncbi:MAG: putative TIM-barrel fold metal-dependent hydrolase [Verrucomicrobiales bacterium]|jgi:predicted TIM-barrel fold metal-dependent hydrolase
MMSEQFGLPPRKRLEGYEIWDSYFTPTGRGQQLLANIERTMPTLEKGAFKRVCLFADPADPEILAPLERWPDLMIAMIRLNAADVRGSIDLLNRWVRDGPMIGVYFLGGAPCSHPDFDPIVTRIAELKGVIMQHTWNKTGGKGSPVESTPAELATLAARFPEQEFICAHAGGEWEQGIRAVRAQPNVLVETSGFDPTAGFIEMAVRELGAERIIFGSHLPSRSLGTELGKVTAADVTEADRRLILGENFRRLAAAQAVR